MQAVTVQSELPLAHTAGTDQSARQRPKGWRARSRREGHGEALEQYFACAQRISALARCPIGCGQETEQPCKQGKAKHTQGVLCRWVRVGCLR